MKTVEIKFTNSDAKPKVTTINCDKASCADIAAWYGCYFSQDRYNIKINGEIVKKDQNGELVDTQFKRQ
jgi:hypothetical protein